MDRCKHTASPLGNGAIVKTADDHIVVLKRGADVGEFPGHPVFPGGHSEVRGKITHSHVFRAYCI